MALLIDGYNLLNSVGITGRSVGVSSLQRSRLALLNFLAESLDPAEAAQTTVVFDAADAPPGLPRVAEHRGMTVRFAAQHEDADALIEELIQADSAPRRLTVVSSDHRVQRAARRRRARGVDSDVWYGQLVTRRHQRRSRRGAPTKPQMPLSEEDVERWLEQFGGEGLWDKLSKEQLAEEAAPSGEPTSKESPGADTAPDKPSPEEASEIENPFPPGYAEDLLEGESPDGDFFDPFPPGYGEDSEQ